MSKFPARREIDYRLFDPSIPQEERKILYGLPRGVKFCKKCVMSNQCPNSAVEYKHVRDSEKPALSFGVDDVCDACVVCEEKKKIDWAEREKELIELCDRFRRTDGKYDCLVPGSGGKDSFYQAHMLKYKYGMNPLTITWAPHIYTDWGWKNHQAWIHAGFDNYLFTPNGKVHRLLTRLAVENLLHPFQPFIIGQKGFAPKIASMFGIKLVFYGENEAEYHNPQKDFSGAKREHKYFAVEDLSNIFISGTSIQELYEDYGLSRNDLDVYLPMDMEEFEKNQPEVHYLGYYLKWHPQGAYYYAVENGNFQASPERTPGTYSKYNSIDDRIDDFHYYTTWIKFGIGRATYDAAQEIRNDEITREEGVSLVRRFDGEFPERFAEEIFQYLSIPEKQFPIASKNFEQPIMTREYFLNLCEDFRSPHLWDYVDGEWKLRFTVFGDNGT